MSIIVWRELDGSLFQGMLLPDRLADLICAGPKYFLGGRSVAYRIRVRARTTADRSTA